MLGPVRDRLDLADSWQRLSSIHGPHDCRNPVGNRAGPQACRTDARTLRGSRPAVGRGFVACAWVALDEGWILKHFVLQISNHPVIKWEVIWRPTHLVF